MSTTPTFVATFLDGEVVRMTTFTLLNKPDLARGIRLAFAAYESRKKQTAPSIVEAHFERNGDVLEHYSREQLDAVPRSEINR